MNFTHIQFCSDSFVQQMSWWDPLFSFVTENKPVYWGAEGGLFMVLHASCGVVGDLSVLVSTWETLSVMHSVTFQTIKYQSNLIQQRDINHLILNYP